MPDIVLTVAEQDVLMRLRPEYVKLYIELRRRMDFGTGVVGHPHAISRNGLRSWCEWEIPRGAGVQRVQMSLQTVRSGLRALASEGLIANKGGGDFLFFLLPKAHTAKNRSNQTQPSPNRVCGTETNRLYPHVDKSIEASNALGFEGGECGGECGETSPEPNRPNASNPTYIGVRRNTSTQQTTSTTCNGVGAGGGRGVVAGLAKMQMADPVAHAVSQSQRDLVAWLVRHGVQTCDTDPALVRLWSDGIEDRWVMDALPVAREQRASAGSAQPVNAGLLAAIARGLSAKATQVASAWWSSPAAMNAKARSLGIAEAMPGEGLDAFKARIRTALAREEWQ